MQEIEASHEMHHPKILQSHSQDHAFTTRPASFLPHVHAKENIVNIHSMDCEVDGKCHKESQETGPVLCVRCTTASALRLAENRKRS